MWRFYFDAGYYWAESCSVVCPGWPKKYFLQLGAPFSLPKNWLIYMRVYTVVFSPKHTKHAVAQQIVVWGCAHSDNKSKQTKSDKHKIVTEWCTLAVIPTKWPLSDHWHDVISWLWSWLWTHTQIKVVTRFCSEMVHPNDLGDWQNSWKHDPNEVQGHKIHEK